MAFYLLTDDRDLLKKLLHENVCSECGGKLEAFYDIAQHLPYLICAAHPEADIEKPNRNKENSYEGGLRTMQQVETQYGTDKARALAKYQGVTSLTRTQAMEIMETIWPDAPVADKLAAAILCSSYGLNPLANHVFLIPYENKTTGVVTWARVWGIKAKRLLASRRGGYSYLDMSPRLMTAEEQIKVWGAVDPANLCYMTLLKDMKTGAEAYGYGKWTNDTLPKGVEKGNSKANMASIRSESQALDRLRPAEMPSGFAVVDEEYIDSEGRIIDTGSGEIIEAKQPIGEASNPVVPQQSPSDAPGRKPNPDSEPVGINGIDIDAILQMMQDKGLKTAGEQRQWIARMFQGISVSGPLDIIIGKLPVEKQKELCAKLSEYVGHPSQR